jgi:hypothetical protein
MLALTGELAKKYGSRDGLGPKGPSRQASLVPAKVSVPTRVEKEDAYHLSIGFCQSLFLGQARCVEEIRL